MLDDLTLLDLSLKDEADANFLYIKLRCRGFTSAKADRAVNFLAGKTVTEDNKKQIIKELEEGLDAK